MKLVVITLCLAVLAFNNVNAETENKDVSDSIARDVISMRKDIVSLKIDAKRQTDKIELLSKENAMLKAKADSLNLLYSKLSDRQERDSTELTGRIVATNDSVRLSKTELQSQLSGRTQWGAGILVVLLLIILVVAYYYHKKISRGSTSIDEVRRVQEGLQKAQTSLQEESIKLDSKLVELIEAQISATPQESGSKEIDHSLTLKVADEIVRMEMNLSRMDPSAKGHKQLSKAVQRIKDNFKANGYEIVDMLGKPYNEGMKVVANFVADESLDEGKQIITGITKPQINYNGKMIQAAQITVSQNI